jgi:hypothetical protein
MACVYVYDPYLPADREGDKDSDTRWEGRRGERGVQTSGRRELRTAHADDNIRACVTLWGGPWVFERCQVVAAGALAMLGY